MSCRLLLTRTLGRSPLLATSSSQSASSLASVAAFSTHGGGGNGSGGRGNSNGSRAPLVAGAFAALAAGAGGVAMLWARKEGGEMPSTMTLKADASEEAEQEVLDKENR